MSRDHGDDKNEGLLGRFFKNPYKPGRLIAGAIPGLGQAADIGLSWFDGDWDKADEEDALNKDLGVKLRTFKGSKAIKKKRDQLDEMPVHATGQAITGAGAFGAGMAAGAAGQVLIPIPGLGWGAGLATSMAADRLYDYLFKTQEQDAVALTAKIRKAQMAGVQDVPPEAVFATLAANLPGKTGKNIEDQLEKLTGTRQFYEAVEAGQYKELTQLMKDPAIDNQIRAATGMPLDEQRVDITAAEQYAALINSGQMDARALLVTTEQTPILEAMCLNCNDPGTAGAPSTRTRNELEDIALAMNQQGVTPAIGDDGQLQFLPLEHTTQRGKA